jgi:putative ABC transport system permease protein
VTLADWGLETVAPGRLRLSSALALYRVRLRRRWVQELLAVVGIACGVALLYATQVASTSLSGPVRAVNGGLVGHSQFQLLARGVAGLPQDTYDRVIALPGVARAAPVLQLPGNIVGPKGEQGVTLFGADPRIVRLRGNLLQGFTSEDAARQETVVIPAPVARSIGVGVGDDVKLQIAGRTVAIPAVVADRQQIGKLVDTSIVLAPLTYLQRLSGAGAEVTRVLVEAKPGRLDEVRRGLARLAGGSMDLRPSDYEARLFDQAAKPTTEATNVFSVLSALVGWLFAVCALLVTASDRRKLAVQQREQGYSPSATLATLFVDAAVIGIVGVALGLAAGELLSRRGFSSDVNFLSGAFPIGDQRVVSWQSVALAAAGGLLAAAFGVLAPVRDVVVASLPGRGRATRAAPAARPRWRRPLTLGGLACMVGAVVIAVAVPAWVVVGLVLLAAALVLLLPLILAGAIDGLERVNRREHSFAGLELARQQLRERRWRTRGLAIAITGAIAAFGATSLEGARGNLEDGLTGVVHGLSSASAVWVAPRGAGDVYGTASFPPTQAAALARLPAVRSVALYRAGLLDLDDRRAWLLGLPTDAPAPIPPHQVLEGDAKLAAARIRAGGWVTMSKALAAALHVGVGERFTLDAPRPASFRLAAITTNLGWSAGAVLMNAPDFARVWNSGAVAAFHVRLARGATPAEGAREVTAALGPRSALRVETSAQRVDRQLTAGLSGLDRLRQIAQLTLLAAVLAMSAAMTGLLWQHRPLIASLKSHGLRAPLLWRALLIETGVLVGTGTLAGGVFGLLGQVLSSRGVQAVTGFPVAQGLRLDVTVTTFALLAGASLLAVVIPGYLVTRVRPSWRE